MPGCLLGSHKLIHHLPVHPSTISSTLDVRTLALPLLHPTYADMGSFDLEMLPRDDSTGLDNDVSQSLQEDELALLNDELGDTKEDKCRLYNDSLSDVTTDVPVPPSRQSGEFQHNPISTAKWALRPKIDSAPDPAGSPSGDRIAVTEEQVRTIRFADETSDGQLERRRAYPANQMTTNGIDLNWQSHSRHRVRFIRTRPPSPCPSPFQEQHIHFTMPLPVSEREARGMTIQRPPSPYPRQDVAEADDEDHGR
ncbi:hypothetical protein M426DRAFT_267478 [Hypoxylon sp. CI-4A]|nr:hypothetical protein M426DRAFT_267478 [Hypoxylon sp. CI-4A]